MGITLNYTTVDAAESKDDWEVIDSAQNIDDSTYPPRQGTECIHFEVPPNDHGGIRNISDSSAFDCSIYEVGVWFLNPVVDVNNKKVVANSDDGIYVRLYSSSGNYANYYQPSHRDQYGEWKGGWLYLRASGIPGEEDSNSGTWDISDTQSIVKVAVYVNTGDGDTTDKDSGKFGVDWSKYYNEIIIAGDNDGAAWTLEDIYNTDIDIDNGGGMWGVVNKSLDFYSVGCGISFGDGDSGKFETSDEYLLIKHKSENPVFDITVRENFEFTSGKKETIGESVYTDGGTIIDTNMHSSFLIYDNSIIGLYSSMIKNFGIVSVGADEDVSIECINSDLCDNLSVSLNASSLIFRGNRVYFTDDKTKNIGSISASISEFTDIKVFNANESFVISENNILQKYYAENNNYDLVVKDEIEVSVIEGKIDSKKLKRIE